MNAVPAGDWTAAIDLEGDDDQRPETESMDIQVFEIHSEPMPSKQFYRLNTTLKPTKK